MSINQSEADESFGLSGVNESSNCNESSNSKQSSAGSGLCGATDIQSAQTQICETHNYSSQSKESSGATTVTVSDASDSTPSTSAGGLPAAYEASQVSEASACKIIQSKPAHVFDVDSLPKYQDHHRVRKFNADCMTGSLGYIGKEKNCFVTFV